MSRKPLDITTFRELKIGEFFTRRGSDDGLRIKIGCDTYYSWVPRVEDVYVYHEGSFTEVVRVTGEFHWAPKTEVEPNVSMVRDESRSEQPVSFNDLECGEWFRYEGGETPYAKYAHDSYINLKTMELCEADIPNAKVLVRIEGEVKWEDAEQ